MLKINKHLILIITFVLSACSNDVSEEKEPSQTAGEFSPSKEQIALNNKGVGEMGSFDYTKATLTFEQLTQQQPDWALAQQNYAIALLNRQKQGDETQALALAEKLSTEDAGNLIAHYIVGILNFNQGLCDKALPHFNTIIQHDKYDAYALYFAGQCHLQNGDIENSLEFYQRAIAVDNYLRSAYYGGFMAAQRLAKTELAQTMLQAYQDLSSNPKARLAEIKYTRMGSKANALAFNRQGEKSTKQANIVQQVLTAPFFSSPIILNSGEVDNFGVTTINAQTQVYTLTDDNFSINSVDFSSKLSKSQIQLTAQASNLAWGDINNDNLIDFYVTGKIDQLYLQTETEFSTVDMNAFGFKQLSSSAVRFADADHDGDLDILLLDEKGQFEIWNNNLNNTFSPLSTKVSLPKSNGYVKIFLQDIDSDRDLDIILQGEKQITTLLNDRMWDYQSFVTSFDSPLLSLTIADNNTDGKPELSLLTKQKIQVLEFDRKQKKYSNINTLKNINANSMLQVDVNGNAQSEYLLVSQQGIKIIDAAGKTLEQILLNGIEKIKTLHTDKGAELLILQNKKLIHIPASDNRAPFVLLDFTGKEDDANSVRSNYSGIGTNFVIHNQGFFALGNSHHNLNGTDQDYQAVSIAAGNKEKIDFIGINWSDGVYQTELALATNQLHKISETQRQLSSCPVIFAWNNGKYEFISDVLGVGGIGFAIGRHEYGVPRPWENYLLTSNQISPQDGLIKLQFTEPMEESAYLDELSIQVLDVPQEYSVTLDERMQISLPRVTGKVLYYKDIISPIKVFNSNNSDVTQSAIITDKKAIELVNKDHRFLGLVDEQVITMEFTQDLIGDYQFIMNGWVEYGYSQTMFAAWQADLTAQAPTLEYESDGSWHTLLTEFGYPAGMPRNASVPITLPEKTTRLRIRTNMEIYFDQLGLIITQTAKNIKFYDLKLQSATLKQLGFPNRQDNTQRVPSYDFNNIQPFWDTRYMQGAYSQLGNVTELLEKQDNALAIIGAGEAIELLYQHDLPELENGFNRFYLLKFKGWAKDMDILTKTGETLKPIPATQKLSEQAKNLMLKYNTRFKAGK